MADISGLNDIVLIGDEVERTPSADEVLDPLIGRTVVDRYEASAEGVSKSLVSGEVRRVSEGDTERDTDSSTEEILKTAARDDMPLWRILEEGFSHIR